MKPKIFIGSSREGVEIANAIHYNLTHDAECTVWKDGVFQLSSNTLSALIEALRAADFGIFVFSPDDVTMMRNTSSDTVRDNVLFELGLFIGRLGQDRCFFLIPDRASNLRLPSDLAGVTPGLYESERSDGNWFAALNPACMQIRMQVSRLKSFQDAVASQAVEKPEEAILQAEPEEPVVEPQGLSARYYKKGILVTGTSPSDRDKISKVGSWNKTLSGWIVPRSREKALVAEYPGLQVEPAKEQ